MIILTKTNDYYLSKGQPYLALLYQAIFIAMYFGLFRISEVTTGAHPVLAKDVHLGKNKRKILFVLRSSKTHCKSMHPQLVKISATAIKDHSSVKTQSNKIVEELKLPCPFQLLRKFAMVRGGYISDEEPFFTFRDRTLVTTNNVRHCLKKVIKLVGFKHAMDPTA